MNIYILVLNNVKYKQYKTFDLAYEKVSNIIKDSKNSKIEILSEEYCEFGHSDSCCKIYLVYKYELGKEYNYMLKNNI